MLTLVPAPTAGATGSAVGAAVGGTASGAGGSGKTDNKGTTSGVIGKAGAAAVVKNIKATVKVRLPAYVDTNTVPNTNTGTTGMGADTTSSDSNPYARTHAMYIAASEGRSTFGTFLGEKIVAEVKDSKRSGFAEALVAVINGNRSDR
jgi:hypothetical protein